jgi:hypothetical protein
MLDQEGTVIAERFRFDVEVDEVMKTLAHRGAGKRAVGLCCTKNSEPHGRDSQFAVAGRPHPDAK